MPGPLVKPLSIALAGVSGYGEFYLSYLLKGAPSLLHLAAVVDPRIEHSFFLKPLTEKGVKLYTDSDAFFKEGRADLLIIAAPIHFHAPYVVSALKRGMHVLCEKPLCATVQEAREMLGAQTTTPGLKAAVGYQWSFSSAIQALKADIINGVFGKPLRLKTFAAWPRTMAYYTRNSWAGALKDAAGRWVFDGPVNNALAHYLHNMFYIIGKTADSSAVPRTVEAELYRAYNIQSYDTAALRCFTEDSVEILMLCSHAVENSKGPICEYVFEKGVVRFDDHILRAAFSDGTTKSYGCPEMQPYRKVEWAAEAILFDQPMPCGIAAAMSQTLCINGMHQSVRESVVFPTDMVHVSHSGKSDQRWVAGLSETLETCFNENTLPSEKGVPWAKKGKSVDLSDSAYIF